MLFIINVKTYANLGEKFFLQIPGVNLPKKDLGYYLVTIFLSALVHEFGHAVAAVRYTRKVTVFNAELSFAKFLLRLSIKSYAVIDRNYYKCCMHLRCRI